MYRQIEIAGPVSPAPGRDAHHALATLHQILVGKPVNWVLEALKNFFGTLDHRPQPRHGNINHTQCIFDRIFGYVANRPVNALRAAQSAEAHQRVC